MTSIIVILVISIFALCGAIFQRIRQSDKYELSGLDEHKPSGFLFIVAIAGGIGILISLAILLVAHALS